MSALVPVLDFEAHRKFLRDSLAEGLSNSDRYKVSIHAKMSVFYWVICAMKLLRIDVRVHRSFIISEIRKSRNDDGGYAWSHDLDSHICATHYVLLSYFLSECIFCWKCYGASVCTHQGHMEPVNTQEECICAFSVSITEILKIKDFILACQSQNGGFRTHLTDTDFAEVDGRSIYNAVYSLKILDKLIDLHVYFIASVDESNEKMIQLLDETRSKNRDRLLEKLKIHREKDIDRKKAVAWLMSTRNPMEAFSAIPGSETHAAFAFTNIAALDALDASVLTDEDKSVIGAWLANRQVGKFGGFNGRPEKAPDVCYSWWISSSLVLLNRFSWIDHVSLYKYICQSQYQKHGEIMGGIADRPGYLPDVFHTLYGLCGVSLIIYDAPSDAAHISDGTALPRQSMETELDMIDHRWCLPKYLVDKFGL